MKKTSLTILITLLSVTVFSQIIIEANYGYGLYSLKDLKDMNSEVLKNLPVEGKITDDFPDQPYYGIGIYYQTSELIAIGITGFYNTTGSRISYKDFSGELKIDNILTSYSPGISIRFKLLDKRLKLFEENKISYSFSKLKMHEEVLNSAEEMTFKSSGLQFEPRFRLSYNISALELGLNAGYLIDFPGKNRLVGDKDAILQYTNSGDEIKTNWSG
ncbi:MAG: hypothetical protein PHH93_11235, partial [Prolixibacteraceae bacterium]|nr:hypothetical protein [Prolixibacteraceae bacterium]